MCSSRTKTCYNNNTLTIANALLKKGTGDAYKS